MTGHWFYVLAAWSAGAALLGGLSVAAILRFRAARAAVAALERQGTGRGAGRGARGGTAGAARPAGASGAAGAG